MPIINVSNLSRDFTYYEKKEGLKASVKNLFHREKKIRHAVKNVSFSIEKGEMVGFLGPNGAGKTTILKMLSGILFPTSGSALVNNYTPSERKDGFKRSFALVAGQRSQLWGDLPASESFYLNKCIYNISTEEYKKTVDELCEMLDVGKFLNVQVRRLSLGERMKMELIAGMLHKPEIFFLDEPTIGLDLISQNTIRNYLKDYNKKNGSTVILTSHYTKDIEDLCDRAIIISGGEKVFDANIEKLHNYIDDKKLITFVFPQEVEENLFDKLDLSISVQGNKATFEVESGNIDFLVRTVFNDFEVTDMKIEEITIEKCIEKIYTSSKVIEEENQ